MMGSVVFCIEGYENDEREVHSIPEVRRFYSAFHAAWPYWLYFCSLEMDTLKTMAMCCLPSLTALKVEGKPTGAVTCDPLLPAGFPEARLRVNEPCLRAGGDVRGPHRAADQGGVRVFRAALRRSGVEGQLGCPVRYASFTRWEFG